MLQDTSPTTTIEWKNDGKRLIWIDLIVAKRDLTADGGTLQVSSIITEIE